MWNGSQLSFSFSTATSVPKFWLNETKKKTNFLKSLLITFWSLAIELFFSQFLSSHYSFIRWTKSTKRMKLRRKEMRWPPHRLAGEMWYVNLMTFFSLFFCHCPSSIMLLAAVKMSIGMPHTIGLGRHRKMTGKYEKQNYYICEKKVFLNF